MREWEIEGGRRHEKHAEGEPSQKYSYAYGIEFPQGEKAGAVGHEKVSKWCKVVFQTLWMVWWTNDRWRMWVCEWSCGT